MSAQKSKRIFSRLDELTDQYGADAGLVICNVGLVVVSFLPVAEARDTFWLVLVGSLVLGGLAFYGLSVWKKARKRQDENVELAKSYIRHLAVDRLGFNENGDCGKRITVYTNRDGAFERFYRYSANERYRESSDDHEALVAREWERGECRFIDGFPTNPGTQTYLQRQKNLLRLTDAQAETLDMKSRLYYVCRISRVGVDHRALAVVLVEAEKRDGFDKDQVQKIFEREEPSFLAELLERVVP